MSLDAARWKPAALLPRPDLRDVSLLFVVAVLVFLACLTALGALSAHRAASGWTSQLQGSATVVVRPRGVESVDAAAAKAAEALAGVKGVAEARALEKDKAEALLEPWIGREALSADLPVPRLVTVDLDRSTPPTTAALEGALRAAGVDATVDDHRLWIADIERAAGTVRWAMLAIFALIALAAAAVIAFATRAGLAAHHDTIEVLHLYGAQPSFISRLFELRFAAVAAVAGLLGASLAAIIGATIRLVGGGEGITPVLPVAWSDLAWLAPAPLAAAAVAALAAHRTAMGLLKEMG
ncbi:MAG TPA: ABC transporter permease [Caulobacteraceae bacterium]|nr:ABC transporter permease [Caulobacteraceae bacterium]